MRDAIYACVGGILILAVVAFIIAGLIVSDMKECETFPRCLGEALRDFDDARTGGPTRQYLKDQLWKCELSTKIAEEDHEACEESFQQYGWGRFADDVCEEGVMK